MSEPSVETILAAKKVARQNGYSVDLPDNKLDVAKNIAQAAGYNVRKATDLDIAIQTVKNAGFDIRKMSDVEQAKQVAQNAGYTVKKDPNAATPPDSVPAPSSDSAPAPTPEDVRKQEDKNYSWIEQVAASLM